MVTPACRIVLLALGLLATGCATTSHRTFADRPSDQVWTALVAAAESPRYEGEPRDRWIVRENNVWADDATRRIEIHRELVRLLQRPATPPLREERTWRFSIRLEDDEPPTAVFVSRGFGVPMHATAEADLYFAEVEALLASAVPPDEPAPLAPPPAREHEVMPLVPIEAVEGGD